MLDADYLMKKMLFGSVPVNIAGYSSVKDYVLKEQNPPPKYASRFWFYPIDTCMGDIQVSQDGCVFLFATGLHALTEQITMTGEKMIRVAGVDPAADQAVASFNKHFHAIAREQPHFKRLCQLNDLVLLCSLWEKVEPRAALLLDRLVNLPYRRVEIPETYPGVETVFDSPTRRYQLIGGVRLKGQGARRTWLMLEDKDMVALRKKIREADFSQNRSVTLSGAAIHVHIPVPPAQNFVADPDAVFETLRAEDYRGAVTAADRAVDARPDDPWPLALRSLAYLCRGNISAANRDAYQAWKLEPDNDVVQLCWKVVELSGAVVPRSRLASFSRTCLGFEQEKKVSAPLTGDCSDDFGPSAWPAKSWKGRSNLITATLSLTPTLDTWN